MKVVVATFLWFVNIHKLDPPLYSMTYQELLVVKLKSFTLSCDPRAAAASPGYALEKLGWNLQMKRRNSTKVLINAFADIDGVIKAGR